MRQALADCSGEHRVADGVAHLEGSADCLLTGIQFLHVRRRAGLLLFPELNIDLKVIKREAEEPVLILFCCFSLGRDEIGGGAGAKPVFAAHVCRGKPLKSPLINFFQGREVLFHIGQIADAVSKRIAVNNEKTSLDALSLIPGVQGQGIVIFRPYHERIGGEFVTKITDAKRYLLKLWCFVEIFVASVPLALLVSEGFDVMAPVFLHDRSSKFFYRFLYLFSIR